MLPWPPSCPPSEVCICHLPCMAWSLSRFIIVSYALNSHLRGSDHHMLSTDHPSQSFVFFIALRTTWKHRSLFIYLDKCVFLLSFFSTRIVSSAWICSCSVPSPWHRADPQQGVFCETFGMNQGWPWTPWVGAFGREAASCCPILLTCYRMYVKRKCEVNLPGGDGIGMSHVSRLRGRLCLSIQMQLGQKTLLGMLSTADYVTLPFIPWAGYGHRCASGASQLPMVFSLCFVPRPQDLLVCPGMGTHVDKRL